MSSVSISSAGRDSRLGARGSRAVGLALVVAPLFLLYWRTAARDLVIGDTPELVTAAATLGVMHPPGYPLATLLGHLFAQLPLGPIPFRVNLLSVVCDTAAAGLIYLTGLRLSGRVMRAAAAALLLGAHPLFWEWSLAAEVFAVNNLLAAAFIHTLVVWSEVPERRAPLIVAALLAGLGLSNHLTFVCLLPGAAWLLWSHRRHLRAKPVVAAAGAAVLGLLPYAYLPWAAARHPYLNWGAIDSVRDLVDHLLRSSYGTHRLVIGVHAGGTPVDRLLAFAGSWGLLTAGLVTAGAVAAWNVNRRYLACATINFLLAGPVFLVVANMNLATEQTKWVFSRFFLLPMVVVAPLVSLGAALAGDALARFLRQSRPAPRFALGVSLAAMVYAGIGVYNHYHALDLSDNHVARHYGEDILASLDSGSILLAGGDEAVLPLAYAQAVEQQRPDVALVMLPLMAGDWYVRELRLRHPDLRLPLERHTSSSPTMLMLVEANAHRPIAIVGDVLDSSLRGKYWFYRRGLVAQVLPMSRDIKLSEMQSDNEALLARYRPPSHDRIRQHTFEHGILLRYASPALAIAGEYEKGGRPAEALSWYRRAAAIAPDHQPLQEALARLELKAPPTHR